MKKTIKTILGNFASAKLQTISRRLIVIALVAVIGFSMIACGDGSGGANNNSYTPPSDSGLKWRSELTHNNGNWHGSYNGIAFFNNFGLDGSMGIYVTGYTDPPTKFTLVSKDDKPASQESSFIVKRSDPGASLTYTIKYILAADGNSLNITDVGGYSGLLAGIYTKVEY